MSLSDERDIVERLRGCASNPNPSRRRYVQSLLVEAADELQSLRASQAKVVEAIKSYRSCWDAGPHRVDLYRQKIATEILSCVEAALAEHGGQT